MDTPEHQPQQQDLLAPRPASGLSPAEEALHQQCQDLRLLFNATFVGLIALCLAVDLFIGKQMRLVRQQIAEQHPAFVRANAEFARGEPEIKAFMNRLHGHAAARADFQTNVLDKYRRALPQYFSAVAIVGRPPPLPSSQRTNLPAPRPAGR